MSLLNSQFTIEKAYQILLDDIHSNEEDFKRLNILNTDEDDAIGQCFSTFFGCGTFFTFVKYHGTLLI